MNTRNIMLVLIAVILLVGSLVGYGLYVNVTSSAHVDKLAAAQYSRVIGAKASLEWWDERPNQLSFEVQGKPAQVLERGMGYLHPDALHDDRIGGGHPEGLFEAWSNLYYRYAQAMVAKDSGAACPVRYPDIPAGVEEGTACRTQSSRETSTRRCTTPSTATTR